MNPITPKQELPKFHLVTWDLSLNFKETSQATTYLYGTITSVRVFKFVVKKTQVHWLTGTRSHTMLFVPTMCCEMAIETGHSDYHCLTSILLSIIDLKD